MSKNEWRHGITADEEVELFRRVSEGKAAKERLDVAERADADERRRLEAAVEGGTDAKAQLANAYRTFAETRARACYRSMIDLLEQRKVYNHTLWSYSLFHAQPREIQEYLQYTDAFLVY